MTRGRKPKPTHLKLIEGNPGKRPIRTGPERPTTAMPEPPDHLNADARTEWDRRAWAACAAAAGGGRSGGIGRLLNRLRPLGAAACDPQQARACGTRIFGLVPRAGDGSRQLYYTSRVSQRVAKARLVNELSEVIHANVNALARHLFTAVESIYDGVARSDAITRMAVVHRGE